ncbi:MAG: hypothetical protein J7L99_03350, partial [Planctomycetes bacterium]|nr:hypothetical protein [Planctomycetota bacterium]
EMGRVIQKGRGKKGLNYIRVTNLRNKAVKKEIDHEILQKYIEMVTHYLRKGRPRTIKIQHIPNLLLYMLRDDELFYSLSDFDDGLIHIGTKYCYNHDNPLCNECPIKELCEGNNEDKSLISDYRT